MNYSFSFNTLSQVDISSLSLAFSLYMLEIKLLREENEKLKEIIK